MHLCVRSEEDPTKEQGILPALPSGASCPSSPSLKPDNYVPPHMSLVFFKQLLHHWSSEQVIPTSTVWIILLGVERKGRNGIGKEGVAEEGGRDTM